ncbi:MAG TPA: hypothetical protein DEQ64_12730 [Lachnoclostridium sp.]|nr:hypothetical protein [Lachnoclostridium sp.]
MEAFADPAVISAAGGGSSCLNAGGTAGTYSHINPVPEYVTVFRGGIFLCLARLNDKIPFTGIKTITFR